MNQMKSKNIFKTILKFATEYGIFVGLIAICLIISFLTPRFYTPSNLINIARQISMNTIIAVGMTFVIIGGGIDLSVGSVVGLVGVITTGMIKSGLGIPAAILIGLLCGGLVGLINGLITARFRIPPFITTLAMMTIARGFALVYTDGRPIWDLPKEFDFIGGGYFGLIPVPVVIMALVLIGAYVVLSQTKFGRYVYALGGNEEAARLSGINTKKIKVIIYTITGALTALSGIILASRLSSGQPTAGTGYELDAIAAVVLGGTSLTGGKGTIFGTLIGALIIGVLDNGLNLLNVSSYYQLVVKGVVIVVAVLMDQMKGK